MTTRIVTDANGRKHITNEPLLHPAQRTWVGLKEEDYVLVNQLCINPTQTAEFVDRLLKERNSV